MNHQAIVAKIDEVREIPGADKIQVAIVLGDEVIVSKDKKVGDVGLLFPADLQLSADFCKHNNLYRDSTYNVDTTKTGFFDLNRRVRVQPFLKVKSQAYFTELSSLSYLDPYKTPQASSLKLGDTFDTLNGVKICEKYINEATRQAIANREKSVKKAVTKPTAPLFEKHVDSAQFKHACHTIKAGSLLHFHSKKHGTSFRTSFTKVYRPLNKFKKFVNKLLPLFPEFKWELVTGTRNVVLANPEKTGFHGSEAFRFEISEQLRPFIEKDRLTVYGEIVGYVNGKSIMPSHNLEGLKNKEMLKKYGKEIKYSYGCSPYEYDFHIYRITYLTEGGKNVDFTQAQLEKWCKDNEFNATLEVHPPIIFDGNHRDLSDLVEKLTERADVLCEDYTDPSHISEGVIVRIDEGNDTPRFLKSKSFAFRVAEGIAQDVDTEDAA